MIGAEDIEAFTSNKDHLKLKQHGVLSSSMSTATGLDARNKPKEKRSIHCISGTNSKLQPFLGLEWKF